VVVFNISNPALAMLTMEIFDEDVTSSEFVAYCSIPLRHLAQGLRSCQLFDQDGRKETDFQFASLSVRACIESLP
jgi:hypothetical protein